MSLSMSKITDKLFIGNINDAFAKDKLHQNGITHIINTTVDIPNYFEDDFEYLRISVNDSFTENISDHFLSVICFIKKVFNDNGIVLIHCHEGISRSVSFAIAFIIYQDKITYDDAFNIIVKNRPIADPNINFIGQLCWFQKKRLGIANNFIGKTCKQIKVGKGVIPRKRRTKTV